MTTAAYDNSLTASMKAARVWRWLAALSILGNIGLNYYSQAYPFNGQTMGAVSAQYPTLITPAGYAFSIWGAIFLALTIYAVWQLLPAQRHNSLPDTIAVPLTVASLATAAWVVLFAYELIGLSVLTMLVILGALIIVYGRARRQVLAGEASAWVSVPFALYLGWISVASAINITLGLRDMGWQTPLNVAVLLAFGLLAVVVALGLIISRAFRESVYPLVLTWALVAIWVAQRAAYPELAWAALVGAVLVGLGGVFLSRSRT
ncbi:hypothetical protein H8B13_18755 [Hymenobacter sp. BT188]|uniref:hypothetical protein n=1 Tax=Hymenobacter sp. BT188 TaxID=2763504 RepID=UPI0016516A2D|nr:hypothetical protein [Hymenobacter sp. BT188]MBC6608869.1 hypothetical protein [Hymenobacter sp. BT188]